MTATHATHVFQGHLRFLHSVKFEVQIALAGASRTLRSCRLSSQQKLQWRGKGGRNVGSRRCAVTLQGAGGAATLRRSAGGRVALRRCDAATLPGAGDAVTLRRCDCDAATLRRCRGPVTLQRCWRCDAATLPSRSDAATLWCCDAGAALRRGIDAATLLALRRGDAATRERRCDAVGAATLRRCDAGSTLRRCWRCDAATRLIYIPSFLHSSIPLLLHFLLSFIHSFKGWRSWSFVMLKM